MLKPIENKSEEYEQAIKSFLGVTLKNKEQTKFADNANRSRSTVAIHNQVKENSSWIEELQKISEKERIIQQSLKELEFTRKSPVRHKVNNRSYPKIPISKENSTHKEKSPTKIAHPHKEALSSKEASILKGASPHRELPHKELPHKHLIHKQLPHKEVPHKEYPQKDLPQQKEIVKSLHKVKILLQKVLTSPMLKQKK